MTGCHGQAVRVITQAARDERDFAGWLADVLAEAAGNLGGSDALTAGRPGSWEAELVDQLVKGTVGYGDQYLPQPSSPPGSYYLDDDEAALVLDALEVAGEYRVYRASLSCGACNRTRGEVCGACAADLGRAEEYAELAERIGEVTR